MDVMHSKEETKRPALSVQKMRAQNLLRYVENKGHPEHVLRE